MDPFADGVEGIAYGFVVDIKPNWQRNYITYQAEYLAESKGKVNDFLDELIEKAL